MTIKLSSKKFAVPMAVITTALLSLSACGSGSSSDEGASSDGTYDGTVKIAHSSWIGFAPLDLAVEKGFFKDHGADVEIENIESKSDSKSALAAGEVQGVATDLSTIVLNNAAGIDSQLVLALDTSDGGDGLISKKEFTSFEDLKGKSIALDTTGGASFFWFNYVCKEEGLSMDDFDVQSMSSGDAGAAFVAGQVDAAMTWQPWLDNAEDTDFGHVLLSSKDYPGVIVDALSMDTKFVEQYPKTVQAVVDGWYDALDYMESDPDDAYKILDEKLGNDDVEATKTQYETEITLYGEQENLDYFGTEDDKGDIYDVADYASKLWKETEMAENEADIDHVINSDFLTRSK